MSADNRGEEKVVPHQQQQRDGGENLAPSGQLEAAVLFDVGLQDDQGALEREERQPVPRLALRVDVPVGHSSSIEYLELLVFWYVGCEEEGGGE